MNLTINNILTNRVLLFLFTSLISLLVDFREKKKQSGKMTKNTMPTMAMALSNPPTNLTEAR